MMRRAAPITRAQYRALLRVLPPDIALVCRIMADTGLRVSDALSITCAQVEAPGGRITVVERKTGKRRSVRLAPRTLTLARIAARGRPPDQALTPIHRTTVYRAIHAAAAALGMQRISPHSLRKYYARKIYAREGLRAAQRALLHDSPYTTLGYLIDMEDAHDNDI